VLSFVEIKKLFVATVLLPERICGERHAVVEVALGGNILEGQALDVAVGITVGKDVHSLLTHLLLHEFTKSQSSISKQFLIKKRSLSWSGDRLSNYPWFNIAIEHVGLARRFSVCCYFWDTSFATI
jgi:hypothetical protein